VVGGALGLSHDGPLAHFLEPVFGTAEQGGELAVPGTVLAVVAVGIALLGAGIAWYLYGSGRSAWLAREQSTGFWRLAGNKLYVDEIYEAFTVTGGRALARLSWLFDQRVLDGAVNGLAAGVLGLAERGRRVQSGLVRSYAVGVLAGAVLLVAVFVLSSTIR
jgi:NADH-quinone oxidoreductase subunit L